MKHLALFAIACLVAVACGDTGTEVTPATVPATDAPATTAPAATEAPATEAPATEAPMESEIVPGEDPDVDAVVTAFTSAFNSTGTFEEKSPFIDDPSGLDTTIAAYNETGESFGGIGVIVTSVVINGDEADVVYDLLFSGNPTYPDLEGKAVRGDSGWQVPRAQFCSVMASARVPCS